MKMIFRSFLGNLPFIILSLILAIAVWIIAQLLRPQTININIPIKITNLPEDMVIIKINTDNIKTTLQARGYDFLKLFVQPPVFNLDLAMAKIGNNRIKLAPDELLVSAPILLKSVNPEYSEITIDQLISKPVVAIVPHRLEPHKGIYITEISYKDTVILYGPEQMMKFIKDISSESLFVLNNNHTAINRKLKLLVPDTNYYRVVPESITVTALIEKESTRTFENIGVNITSGNQPVTLKPKIANITIRGAKTIIDSIKTSDIKLRIDASKLSSGEHQIPAEISLPKGIFLVQCEPKLFEVKVR